MYLRPLVNYIAAETGLVIDVNLFAGCFAKETTNAVCIIQRTPEAPNEFLHDVVEKNIQVFSRHVNYSEAENLNRLVCNLFNGIANVNLPVITPGQDFRIDVARVIGQVGWLGQNQKDHHEFTGNIWLRLASN